MIVYKSRVRPEANVIDKVRFRTGVTNYNHFAEIVVFSFFFLQISAATLFSAEQAVE